LIDLGEDNESWYKFTFFYRIPLTWGKTIKSIGIKYIRFHDSRHIHASLMLKQGIHPKVVQERLGHSSISITLDTYIHVALCLQKQQQEGLTGLQE